jgi:hypothetical protein
MKDVTPSIQDATPSRPASVFWQPPPEAEVICESEKSPSFLLYAKAEDRKGAAGEREETNASETTEYGGVRWGPSQNTLGTSSSKAVMSAVCSTLSNQVLLPSSSVRPRRENSQASFLITPTSP